jgi:hypothetical protein
VLAFPEGLMGAVVRLQDRIACRSQGHAARRGRPTGEP